MGKIRLIFFAVLIIGGAGLIALLTIKKPQTPMDASFAPAFQLIGRSTRSLSRALTRVMPINDLDEKEYGDAIAARYKHTADKDDRDHVYVNEVMRTIVKSARKPFIYRVFIMNNPSPNAFACPGGVIFVTRGLLKIMESESEIAAVLAHEMGHVERSHCIDAVRFQLLTKKVGSTTLGKIADFAVNIMVRHSYSKTQEDDADSYAFDCIKDTDYDPAAVASAFQAFLDFYGKEDHPENEKAHLLREYFMSHPHMVHRVEKYSEYAKRWWDTHEEAERYRGKKNLKNRVPMRKEVFKSEWFKADTAKKKNKK